MDRYRGDPLSRNWRRPKVVPEVAADPDLVVEEAESGFCGAVVEIEKGPGGKQIQLEDPDGNPVELFEPRDMN